MEVGNSSNGNGPLMMNGEQVEPVEEFCYLGSILTNNENCCKDVRTRIAKTNLAFSRLNNIWHDRKLKLPIKIGCTHVCVLTTCPGLSVTVIIMLLHAPCRLRGCKNEPAPFSGRMSYKATKPGLVCLSYLSMLYYCIVIY